MIDSRALLNRILPGDIFHAESPSGASLICLAVSVTSSHIDARTVTTQIHLHFSKENATAPTSTGRVPCEIDSVTPVPPEIHAILLGLDRKFRLEYRKEKLALTDDEIRALVFVDSFYKENPLPRG